MAHCSKCGTETESFSSGVTYCVPCIDEIMKRAGAELTAAREEYRKACEAFDTAVLNPSTSKRDRNETISMANLNMKDAMRRVDIATETYAALYRKPRDESEGRIEGVIGSKLP